jgi:cell division protein FtsN
VSTRRLTGRDFKKAQRRGLQFGRWREFGYGLALGLAVALAVYVSDHRGRQASEEVTPTPRKQVKNGRETPPPTALDESEFSFYQRLPSFEVVVPEKERTARVSGAAKVEQPGTYFLQVGSYKDQTEAERVRAQLAREDIEATVQRIAVDSDVWHRVRVGPIKDLAQLNRVRQQLKAADHDSLVIRVVE